MPSYAPHSVTSNKSTELYSYTEQGKEVCYTLGAHGSFLKTTISAHGNLSAIPYFELDFKEELTQAIKKHGIPTGENADKQIYALATSNIFTPKELQSMDVTADIIQDAANRHNPYEMIGLKISRGGDEGWSR